MKWLSNIKISTRLITGFSSAIVSMVLIIFLALNSLTTIKESINDLNADKYRKTVLINDIIDIINAIGKEFRDMVIIADASQISDNKEKIDEYTQKAASTLSKLKPMLKTEKAKENMLVFN